LFNKKYFKNLRKNTIIGFPYEDGGTLFKFLKEGDL